MPHTEVHGTVTGTEDGKHAKADTELGEIALKNKLFFCCCCERHEVFPGVSSNGQEWGEQKGTGSNSCENVALSRSMAGNDVPSIPTRQEPVLDVHQISVGSVRRRWYICVTMDC